MPTSAWEIAKDLGIFTFAGSVSILIAVGSIKLLRARWAAHTLRRAREDAQFDATDMLIEDALHRPKSGEIRAASDRAAREERLKTAKERLDQCRPKQRS